MMKNFKKNVLSIICLCTLILLLTVSGTAVEPEQGYAVNEHGDTYGTMLQAEELGFDPDLILAIGEGNIEGYVKSSDLVYIPANPSEAQENADSLTEDYYIPLYASDGVTVIGRFLVTVNNDQDCTQMRSAWANGSKRWMYPPNYTAYATNYIKGSVLGVTAKTTINSLTIDKNTDFTANPSWLGIQVRIWQGSTGAVVKSSKMEYNRSATSEFSQELYYMVSDGDEYASKGIVAVWNTETNGYWTYQTYISPYVLPNS